ncbi:FtsX-like permease family protein [Comamonadaceae bacterium G21597-S1]|nr:FtsX-like permease family protein [Comamonadaceae bacterium G21597-S1]
MMTFNLALRNLLRNRRRSLATLLGMAIGSSAILLFGGFKVNIGHEMQTTHVQKDGHLQIQHRDFYLYGSGNPIAYGISNYQNLLAAINGDEILRDLVLVATPALQFGGIAGNYSASVSRTVIGHGYVAEDINRMRQWNDFGLRSKAPLSAMEGSSPDAAVVGTGVARVLQLCDALKIDQCPKPVQQAKSDGEAMPDDIAQLGMLEKPPAGTSGPSGAPKIEVLVVNARGAPNVASLQVIRAEDQGIKELDEVSMIMHLERLQQLVYGRSTPKATSIMLQLRRSEQMPVARARLQPILDRFSVDQPLTILDFQELNPFFVQTMLMFDTIFGFVFLLIGSIVLFTVSNTMNTTVVERTVEIGTLRAIGLRRGGILRLFVLEGALLGVFGAVLGAVLALVLSVAINHSGMTWLPPASVAPLPFTISVWGQNSMIFGTTFGLIVIATLSAWWPAYRAARLDVVDALRHV